MKVRGREEPWCTGPGWYWRGRVWAPMQRHGPYSSKVDAHRECRLVIMADAAVSGLRTTLEGLWFFQITPADIEAET